MESANASSPFGDARQIAVERAIAEFRAARPVAIRSGSTALIAFPVDGATEAAMAFLQRGDGKPRVIVPGEKILAAGKWIRPVAALTLEPFTMEALDAYFGRDERVTAAANESFRAADRAEVAGLALSNLALLLPAVLVADAGASARDALPLLTVDAEDVFGFRDREAKALKIVSRALVPLEGAGSCEFVVFRGGDGFRDQIAILVGNPTPGKPVSARIHSACLTGDLFGSLKCDCGEQLRGTVRAMAEEGGGAVLYLDQEGRGNGIANKIRAYRLQDQGFDTYDADELLGFGQDQRRFDFAADMLRLLGFTSVRLMTNNPLKIKALRDGGLNVLSTHRVLTRPTAQNVKYLAAKRDKAGHLLGDAGLDTFDSGEHPLSPARHP
ncbi:GTP cyclohydrolase [Rhodomicrobium udaipurense JA643]|uniref:GTP cyclohydrolase-2 n=1 Tax=Rhodomicrobium udaipurense TaxID=1202716 RepID=A0A8I1GF83_9HYPH|nr:GTP cyclohydrolase II RibA [Rhodomicrobium udaipurense]KAI95131.1 GTP cyclohydrolase [Rhodomicrobium udaipurense JA643]MBJ7543904.1 GTP cyclohydrolase II RibA [Rhodomicrobium udaipurense]